MSQKQTIFERLGAAAVDAAVDVFYQKVLTDDLLQPFFEGVNMVRQKQKQAKFLTFVFGGPNDYQGRSMRAAHLHLIRNKGLSLEHFDKVAEHFVATLTELNVPSDIIDEATEILLSTRDQFGPLTEEEKTALCIDAEPTTETSNLGTAAPSDLGKLTPTLYERLGEAAVQAAVDLFYEKLLADPRLSVFFQGVDMRVQKLEQHQFLTFVFNGPNNHKGEDLQAAYVASLRNRGLETEHFDIVAELLVETLQEANVPDETLIEAADTFLSVRTHFEPVGPHEAQYVSAEEEQPTQDETPTKVSLYDQLGGEAISAAVEVFYKKMLSDPRVSKFFEGIDMKSQKRKQASFLSYVFGCPAAYQGKQLRSAHVHMMRDKGLNMEHFDITADHFVATLQELQLPQHAIDEATGVLLSTRKFFEPLTEEELRSMANPQESYGDLSQPSQPAESSNDNTATTKKPSIFDRLGEAAVAAAVDEFYKRMLADDRVNKFFQGIDMKVQKHKQAQFLSYAFGGPEGYKGKDLRTAHLHLIRDKGLNMTHFDIVAEHFVATLHHLSVPQDIVDEATATLLGTKKYFEPLTQEEERAMAEKDVRPVGQCPYSKAASKAAVTVVAEQASEDSPRCPW